MILNQIKRKSLVCLFGYLLLCSVFINCSKYKADTQHGDSCSGEFCAVEDEFDVPCMDEGEDVEYNSEGLYRWDPMKVSN